MRLDLWKAGTCFLAFFLVTIVVFLNNSAYAQMENAGVTIDANSVLSVHTYLEPSLQALKARKAQSAENIQEDLVAYTPLRYVSLTRLEREVAQSGGNISDEVRYMGGLLKIDYVFVYPETKDVVLAGPAEGWYKDASGRAVGLSTGKPVLLLEDMVAALRAFPPGKMGAPIIGCSIDPTADGLVNMQQKIAAIHAQRQTPAPAVIQKTLRESLGMQEVSVTGVNPKTHFARAMVEADYRMKLIGVGLENPPVKMRTFIGSARPSQISQNALFRWYFVPNYECVKMSPDKLAIQLVGQGVKLQDANEMVLQDGQREQTVTINPASRAFTESFTENYPKIAEKTPIYAELRNLIDMSVVAAYMQKEQIYEKLGWSLVLFGNENRFPIETGTAPKYVESAVGAVMRGNTLMTPIGGGVEIRSAKALDAENLINPKDADVEKQRKEIEAAVPDEGWWWN
ncbi:MAG: DUF1598 domain-containing protein [Planctomycetia bacterium]|nr:DUF1598 domain-containing protein [Planctomycetia bacterium]